ncbi:DNA methyltransferase [Pigmentibacter ruber]|uniref:DNA methyltransferase n=1 Tax=Pigmentibacter ruber TaxID=2683196 RepID=UPI00131E89B6|nr:DNA methyltransferase [Pigmentibacter ruber]
MQNKKMSIQIEGTLFNRDFIESLTAKSKEFSLKYEDYVTDKNNETKVTKLSSLSEKIHQAWNHSLELWKEWQIVLQSQEYKEKELNAQTNITYNNYKHDRFVCYNDFYQLFLANILGFQTPDLLGTIFQSNDNSYEISFIHKNCAPVQVLCPWENFESTKKLIITKVNSLDEHLQQRKVSPHSFLQELLNSTSEYLWGMLFNGTSIRLLRDSASLIRQSYIEFHLDVIFAENDLASFEKLFLLCHSNMFLPYKVGKKSECKLEYFHTEAIKRGVRALDKLKDGVSKAIEYLATGFLSSYSAAGETLRAQLENGELSTQEFYRQTLRWVYRLVFIFVAEERNLLHGNKVSDKTRKLYLEYYSTQRLRNMALTGVTGGEHTDLWQGFLIVNNALGQDNGLPQLGLPGLGGFLFQENATANLNATYVSNFYFLSALRSLCYTYDANGNRQKVNWGHLGAEELGGVYESLLPIVPKVNLINKIVTLFEDNTENSNERKATGAHYTPSNILNTVLDFALKNAIEDALEKGTSKAEKIKQLLKVKVLDPACGSGHFLVAAAHRIALELAKLRTGDESPSPEDYRIALREVIRKNIYGLDVNPMAIDLCRVALWMESMEAGKPLSFLEPHIKVGDALIGVPTSKMVEKFKDLAKKNIDELTQKNNAILTRLNSNAKDLDDAEVTAKKKALQENKIKMKEWEYEGWSDHIPLAAFSAHPAFPDPAGRGLHYSADDKEIVKKALQKYKDEKDKPATLFDAPIQEQSAENFAELLEQDVETLSQRKEFEQKYLKLQNEVKYQTQKLQADLWCAAFFWRYEKNGVESIGHKYFKNPEKVPAKVKAETQRLANLYHFFHLELEWPEIFSAGGFHCIIGNPPFLGGKTISSNLGNKFLLYLKNINRFSDSATDLCAYFFYKYFLCLKQNGHLGFIATNTISQGDSKEASLQPIINDYNGEIANAFDSIPWEGVANIQVSCVHIQNGKFQKEKYLNGDKVNLINAELSEKQVFIKFNLTENNKQSFQGVVILGNDFTLDPQTDYPKMLHHLSQEECNPEEIIFPYINGDDLNTHPEQQASRYVINFFDWPLRRASKQEWQKFLIKEPNEEKLIKKMRQKGVTHPSYKEPVATDFPSALHRIEKLIKPEREKVNRERLQKIWWQFAEVRPTLSAKLAKIKETIVLTFVSAHWAPTFLPTRNIFSHAIGVIPTENKTIYSILQSHFHEIWLDNNCSSLEKRRRYTPSDCFDTFPFPRPTREQNIKLQTLGEQYLALRKSICKTRQIGLTNVYNLFHYPDLHKVPIYQKQAAPFDDILQLRALHKEINEAVCTAYGWEINLEMAFYEGKDAGKYLDKGQFRYCPSPAAQDIILTKLAELNNVRKQEEEELLSLGKPIPKSFSYFEIDKQPEIRNNLKNNMKKTPIKKGKSEELLV